MHLCFVHICIPVPHQTHTNLLFLSEMWFVAWLPLPWGVWGCAGHSGSWRDGERRFKQTAQVLLPINEPLIQPCSSLHCFCVLSRVMPFYVLLPFISAWCPIQIVSYHLSLFSTPGLPEPFSRASSFTMVSILSPSLFQLFLTVMEDGWLKSALAYFSSPWTHWYRKTELNVSIDFDRGRGKCIGL